MPALQDGIVDCGFIILYVWYTYLKRVNFELQNACCELITHGTPITSTTYHMAPQKNFAAGDVKSVNTANIIVKTIIIVIA